MLAIGGSHHPRFKLPLLVHHGHQGPAGQGVGGHIAGVEAGIEPEHVVAGFIPGGPVTAEGLLDPGSPFYAFTRGGAHQGITGALGAHGVGHDQGGTTKEPALNAS